MSFDPTPSPPPPSGHNPYQSPSSVPPPVPPGSLPAADGTGGLIPYKNSSALIAYYLGVFSLIPCVGLFLAIPAFLLGLNGLKAYKRQPQIKGVVHAWIGIVMGALMTLVWAGLMLAPFIMGAFK